MKPSMESNAATVARAVATRLETSRPGTEADVEAALHDPDRRADQYVLDPVSFASLVVSVATLAWTVYIDMKTKTPKPATQDVKRTIRLELQGDRTPAVDAREAEHVIDLTVEEITRQSEDG